MGVGGGGQHILAGRAWPSRCQARSYGWDSAGTQAAGPDPVLPRQGSSQLLPPSAPSPALRAVRMGPARSQPSTEGGASLSPGDSSLRQTREEPH